MDILAICLFDLKNTTSDVSEIETLLKLAKNRKIVFVPIKMETVSQVYYMDFNLNTNRGFEYTGLTDDQRAISSFVGRIFEGLKPVLPGREKTFVYCSDLYEKEGRILESLIKGQRLDGEVILTNNPADIISIFEVVA